jgi:hypothetical protein
MPAAPVGSDRERRRGEDGGTVHEYDAGVVLFVHLARVGAEQELAAGLTRNVRS